MTCSAKCPSTICCEKCRTMICSEKCCTMPKVRNATWVTITRSVYCYFEDSSYLAYGPITWFMKDSMISEMRKEIYFLLLIYYYSHRILFIYCILFFSMAQRLVTIWSSYNYFHTYFFSFISVPYQSDQFILLFCINYRYRAILRQWLW